MTIRVLCAPPPLRPVLVGFCATVMADRRPLHQRRRIRCRGVGLSIVAGVEEPHPGGELRGNVDDMLAGLEKPLGEWSAGTVGACDCPDSIGPGLGVGPHGCVAGLVGSEPP